LVIFAISQKGMSNAGFCQGLLSVPKRNDI
jgi:hypothetical protein